MADERAAKGEERLADAGASLMPHGQPPVAAEAVGALDLFAGDAVRDASLTAGGSAAVIIVSLVGMGLTRTL
ncbi:MAG: hypothetical protein IT337_15795, partial [Thermomicrobiales bacterium]|nr:hypothetical protein [Thermomicrobiales bacterium]